MQVLAGGCRVGAALTYGPIVACLGSRLQPIADDAYVGRRGGGRGGERVRKRAPGRLALAQIGGLAGPVWDEGV